MGPEQGLISGTGQPALAPGRPHPSRRGSQTWSPTGAPVRVPAGQGVETELDRKGKSELVATLKGTFREAELVVVTHNQGLTVAETTDLRRRTRGAGASFRVTKNRLARRALAGTRFEGLGNLFTGPTAIAYSKDPVAAAKVMVDYAKGNEKLVILGASLGGKVLNVEGVKALATLPSLDQLRGKILGLIQTPAIRIASVLKAPAGQVARVIAAHAKKGEAA